ncbi:hypothetical protein HMSSN036_83730 [Paenibacillus macerans]|nr:hypothetical protein HMSSN036_83730 [Paenibacillus macerans]
MKPLESNPKVPYVVGSKSPTAVAINCASKAGEWIKSKLGGYGELGTKLSSRDLVTDVDKGAEAMIRKLILTHFPDHSILGEEGVAPGAAASEAALAAASEAEYLWIVDPIDGTTNFVHGFPVFCVSIALAYRGEVTVGVIYDPMRDELFLAEKGKRRLYARSKMQGLGGAGACGQRGGGRLQPRPGVCAAGEYARPERLVRGGSQPARRRLGRPASGLCRGRPAERIL